MNFFEHQAQAHKKTLWLVLMLILAVLCLIAISIVSISLFFYYFRVHATSMDAAAAYSTSFLVHLSHLVQSPIALWVTAVIITVVVTASLYKLFVLRRGGAAVAESLDCKLIASNTTDPASRLLLNVVEEMAIASGNPVPPVYLLQENSINAFAAGLTRRDAVIGVTQGALDQLNREQLQGVIAHEFSHIHNGDMRLNLRLVAILHGILAIGFIGQLIMRGSGRSRARRGGKGNNIALLGLLLVLIGYAGTFFGNLIKAAVSREREFLADASAVQFTRNPKGISGALKRIGGLPEGSAIRSGPAEQFSHLFFASGVAHWFGKWMATHPPLTERIRRLEPSWRGEFDTQKENNAGEDQARSGATYFASKATTINADRLIEQSGMVSEESFAHAQKRLSMLPQALKSAAHEVYSARAVIYLLLLSQDDRERQQQLRLLEKLAGDHILDVLHGLMNSYHQLDRSLVLTLVDLCLPSLKQLSKAQYSQFKRGMLSMIYADKHISLFEWCLYRIVSQTLQPPKTTRSYKLDQVKHEASLVKAMMEKSADLCSDERVALDYQQLDQALGKLNNLRPLDKPAFLKSLLTENEKVLRIESQELFRAVADSINCPVPPI